MLIRSVFLSLLTLFSTTLFAMSKIDPIPASEVVVMKGPGFELKQDELQKFLEEAYNNFPISNISVTWSYNLSGRDSQYKEVRFTINAHKEYQISCTLHTSSRYNIISTRDCDSSPEAVVSDVAMRLSDYTLITPKFSSH